MERKQGRPCVHCGKVLTIYGDTPFVDMAGGPTCWPCWKHQQAHEWLAIHAREHQEGPPWPHDQEGGEACHGDVLLERAARLAEGS